MIPGWVGDVLIWVPALVLIVLWRMGANVGPWVVLYLTVAGITLVVSNV